MSRCVVQPHAAKVGIIPDRVARCPTTQRDTESSVVQIEALVQIDLVCTLQEECWKNE
jgi:hypothetical protein